MNLGLEVAIGGVRGGTSILYAGLGETVSERAGVVNLGIEGSMLVRRARRAYAANAASGNPWIGALGGAAAGGALALVHAYFVLSRRRQPARHRPRGAVPRASASPRCSAPPTSSEIITPFTPWNVPGALRHPVDRRDLLQADPLTYISLLRWCPLVWWLLFRSRWGLLVRGAGERTEVLRTYGHRRCSCSTSRS